MEAISIQQPMKILESTNSYGKQTRRNFICVHDKMVDSFPVNWDFEISSI